MGRCTDVLVKSVLNTDFSDLWSLDYDARPDNAGRANSHYFAVKNVEATKNDIQTRLNLVQQELSETD